MKTMPSVHALAEDGVRGAGGDHAGREATARRSYIWEDEGGSVMQPGQERAGQA